jgi:hypothetical protein
MTVSAPIWAEEFRIVKKVSYDRDTVTQASMIAYRGEIAIAGTVKGSVLQLGGKLTVSGTVTEDIIALGTDIVLQDGARIEGDFLLVGGSLNRSDSALIKGEYFFVKMGSKEIDSTSFPLIWGEKTITLIKFIKIILWLLLGLMVYAVIPQRIHAISMIWNTGNKGRTTLLGFLILVVGFFLLLFFTLLSLIMIGIPFLLILLILGSLLLLVSRTVMLYLMGSRIASLLHRSNPILFIILGAVVYGIIKFIPFLGTPILLLIDLVGSGLVLSYLLFLKKSRQS